MNNDVPHHNFEFIKIHPIEEWPPLFTYTDDYYPLSLATIEAYFKLLDHYDEW